MNTEFLLEILNGDWGIVALALAVICGFYLSHEIIAYGTWGRGWRSRLTKGMRMAIAIGTMSVGVFWRSAEVYRWRHSASGIEHLSQFGLVASGIIAVIGFLCMIREICLALYGNAPWVWTLAAMAAFTALSVGFRLWGG